MNAAEVLRELANSSDALERARKRVEDELVEWRDSGMSMLGRRNGLAIFSQDGTPSSIIRFGFEDAFRIALNTEADRMEAGATP